VLLRYHDERHWLRAAPTRVGYLFPHLIGQSEYNQRLKGAAPLLEAALRWLAEQTPRSRNGTVTGFGLANPKLLGEREAVRQLLHQPANRPPAGSAVVTDKDLSGEDTEAFFAGLELALIRPARRDEHDPGSFPDWLRQRVEALIWTLKHQLGLEAHGGRVPAGLGGRLVQRLLALNAAIWHNWALGAPVKRSLIAYDH
jgi:hypothetical protein